MKDKEIRNYQTEIRSNDNSRHIEGKAICFNSLSEDLGFRELIKPEACTQEFLDTQDVLMLFNHTDDRGILARSNKGIGNLNLEVRDDGVYFAFDALNTSLGDEVLEYIRCGIAKNCSFAFTVDSDGETWERRSDGQVYRTINKFDGIYDCSIVLSPAYSATSVSCRSFDKFKNEEIKAKLENELKNIDNL